MKATCLVLAMASLALYHPEPARACSPPPCWPAAFVPDQGKVPANVPGLFWRPMSGPAASADPRNVVLATAAAPTTPIAFTAQPFANGDYLLVPVAPLAEGSYVLGDRNTCSATGATGPQVAFTVGPAAPLPTDLGILIAPAPSIADLDLETRTGSCSSRATTAQASFELVPSSSALAWREALHFETLVDGQPWSYQTSLNVRVAPGASPTGRGRDRVFSVCASDDKSLVGLAPGAHTVAMRATLPGTKNMLTSSTLDVTLRCEVAPPITPPPSDPPDDGRVAAGDEGCSAGHPGAAAGLVIAWLALRPRMRRRLA
jgi:hypothetical protein